MFFKTLQFIIFYILVTFSGLIQTSQNENLHDQFYGYPGFAGYEEGRENLVHNNVNVSTSVSNMSVDLSKRMLAQIIFTDIPSLEKLSIAEYPIEEVITWDYALGNVQNYFQCIKQFLQKYYDAICSRSSFLDFIVTFQERRGFVNICSSWPERFDFMNIFRKQCEDTREMIAYHNALKEFKQCLQAEIGTKFFELEQNIQNRFDAYKEYVVNILQSSRNEFLARRSSDESSWGVLAGLVNLFTNEQVHRDEQIQHLDLLLSVVNRQRLQLNKTVFHEMLQSFMTEYDAQCNLWLQDQQRRFPEVRRGFPEKPGLGTALKIVTSLFQDLRDGVARFL